MKFFKEVGDFFKTMKGESSKWENEPDNAGRFNIHIIEDGWELEDSDEMGKGYQPQAPREGDDPFDVAKIREKLRKQKNIPEEGTEPKAFVPTPQEETAQQVFKPRVRSAYSVKEQQDSLSDLSESAREEPPVVEPVSNEKNQPAAYRVDEPKPVVAPGPAPENNPQTKPEYQPAPKPEFTPPATPNPSEPSQPIRLDPASKAGEEEVDGKLFSRELEVSPLPKESNKMQFHTDELEDASAYHAREVIMDNEFPANQVAPQETNESWFSDLMLDVSTETSESKIASSEELPSGEAVDTRKKGKYARVKSPTIEVELKETEKSRSEVTGETDEFLKDKKAAFALRRQLSIERRDLFLSSLGTIFLELILIWLAVGSRVSGLLPAIVQPQTKPYIYILLNLFVLLLTGLAARYTIISGYNEVINRTPSIDSAVTVGAAVSVLQCILLLFAGKGVSEGLYHSYAVIAGFCLMINTIGKLLFITRTRNNFDYLCATGPKYSLLHIEDEAEAIQMSNGLVNDAPVVAYPVRIKNVSSYLEEAKSENPAEKLVRKYMKYFWLGTLVIAIVSMFTQKSFLQGISALTLLTLTAVPASALLISNIPFLTLSRLAHKGRGIIAGYGAIKKNTGMNAVVVEASQLFDEQGAVLHGIKTFGGTRVDEAILNTASVIYAADSPMKFIFDQILDGRSDILPDVEHLVYEDQIGLSAWVNDKRILVGNKDLMRHHSVVCPTKSYESKYMQRGRHIVYLAIDGLLSAMFVVSYRPSRFIHDRLQRLTKLGVAILVNSTDQSITSDYLADLFDLPRDNIKVMAANASHVYIESVKRNTDCVPPAGIVFNGSLPSYLDSLLGVARLNLSIRLSTLIQCIAVLLGVLLLGVISLISGLSSITPLHVLVFEVFWLAAVNIVANIRRA